MPLVALPSFKMIQITRKEDCCGCHACLAICPRKCISMQEDAEGFLYPRVDEEQCVDCHLCEKVCPVILSSPKSGEREKVGFLEIPAVYAAQCRDDELRMSSSSGGIFSVLALQVIKKGGVVFGAQWSDDFSEVHHGWTDYPEGLASFRGSKYLQSRMGGTFKEVRKFLNEGRQVLFTGTPCQVAGLKAFLKGKDKGLLAVAIACHSAPSPKVWRTFLQDLKRKAGFSKVTEVDFRRKNISHSDCSDFYMAGDAGSYRGQTYGLAFGEGFLKGLFSRPVCHECPTRGWKHGSDMIIGDFWGVKRYWPELDVGRGISVVVCCTERGRDAFDGLKTELGVLKEATWEWAVIDNGGLRGGMEHHPAREKFFTEFLAAKDEREAVKVMRKFTRPVFVDTMKVFLMRCRRFACKMGETFFWQSRFRRKL